MTRREDKMFVVLTLIDGKEIWLYDNDPLILTIDGEIVNNVEYDDSFLLN